MNSLENIKLTSYSHGAGCGCKLSPAVLSEILKENSSGSSFSPLLVGNEHKDDAAVWKLDDGTTVISTTDFFMPIVDDPFDFGRIAATNAISDIYAMGGKPIMAIAILGWPIDKLPASVASLVIAGGKAICEEAGIPLAGGHSIDCPEPIFGLAVTGISRVEYLKTNAGAKSGDFLYLTKPLGVGLMSTAQKKGILKPEHAEAAVKQMTTLNRIGEVLSTKSYVHALTDVTGFGILGHLIELCEASDISSELMFNQLPLINGLQEYLAAGTAPGGTSRNYASYGHKAAIGPEERKWILCDPQTSGGLLIAVDPEAQPIFEQEMRDQNQFIRRIGQMIEKKTFAVKVI